MASYNYSESDLMTWGIVNVVFTGIFIKPLFILWLVSLCLVRRRNALRQTDHARVGFTYMKVVYPLYAFALFLYAVSGGIYIFLVPYLMNDSSYYYNYNYNEETMNTLYNVQVRVLSIGQIFDDISTALLVITLVEIGSGFLYVKQHGVRTGLQKAARWATLAVAGIISVIAIARLGLLNWVWTTYFNYRGGSEDDGYLVTHSYARELRTSNQLSAAVTLLFWIATLPVVVYAGVVLHKVKGLRMRSSAVILLVASILLFVRYTWQLVYVALWVLPISSGRSPIAINAVDPVLTVWVTFVLLVLLFVIGLRKDNGLWSVAAPGQQQQPNWAQQPQQPIYYPPHGPVYGYPSHTQGSPQYGQGYVPMHGAADDGHREK